MSRWGVPVTGRHHAQCVPDEGEVRRGRSDPDEGGSEDGRHHVPHREAVHEAQRSSAAGGSVTGEDGTPSSGPIRGTSASWNSPSAGHPGPQSGEEARTLERLAGVQYSPGMLQVETTANAVCQTAHYGVWIPKYRRRVLTGMVATRLCEILHTIAHQNRWRGMAVEIDPDHLHVCVSVPPTMAAADAVRRLKGASTRRLRALCPHHREICRHGHVWAPSCCAGSAGNVSAPTIRRDIERAAHVPSRR